MESNFDVNVVPGQIIINSGDLILCKSQVEIWEFDFRSKYAGLMCTGVGSDFTTGKYSYSVSFHAAEETLFYDTSVNIWTDIQFFPKDGCRDWRLMVDGGRYSWTIALFKRDSSVEDSNHFFEYRHLWKENGVK